MSRDPQMANEIVVKQLLAGEYDAIYDDADIELKALMKRDIFRDLMKLEDELFGRYTDIELVDDAGGGQHLFTSRRLTYQANRQKLARPQKPG